MTQSTRAALIKFAIVSGAGADTNIAVAAKDGTTIGLNDTIIACIELAVTTNLPTDRTSTTSITSAGNIQCSVATTSDKLVIWWMSQDTAAGQVDSPWLEGAVVDGVAANTNITVPGLTTADDLYMVVDVDSLTGAWTDRTDVASITAANTIQLSVSTTESQLIVAWLAKDSVRADKSVRYKFAVVQLDVSEGHDITLTGIETTDTVMLAFVVDETGGRALDEVSADITITATNTIRLDWPSPLPSLKPSPLIPSPSPAGDYVSANVLVFWHDRNVTW